MNENNATIESVCGLLEADGIHYRICEDPLAIEPGFTGRDCRFLMRIRVAGDPSKAPLLVLVRSPLVVPEDQRPAMAGAAKLGTMQLSAHFSKIQTLRNARADFDSPARASRPGRSRG